MIVLFGGQKGGSGKSTLAMNVGALLASQGKDVLMIDGNSTQGTLSNWAARRESTELPQLTYVEKSGNLYKTLDSLRSKYDHVIVDTGGQDSKEFRTAMLAADVMISPIKPTQADTETLVYVSSLIEQALEMNAELKCYIVVSQARPNPRIKAVEETRTLVSSLEFFSLLDSVIYTRKSYEDAVAAGASAAEMGDKKAAIEIENLVNEVFS
ncbi:AAA family ATPase [Paraglaciecola polaris]|uniref:Chromosome partitioning protein n=1 Tax=Paraglaciecola polaris LMG 21857 TaxID=1129793 RepID=K7AJU9_9ALTE|nr:AAA family ATPase [Paraglaciecola polaris]GAC35650.1 chromosome partitioning protein [Paraglaciecola polaris LMG 21857]|tara:strand:- start:3192 stop:3824 length:633 start_codon:yes stop_codon:yes gene_type:complete